MSEPSFFQDSARAETKKAVQEIEAKSSAEIVVALRRSAGDYREADYLFGFLLGLVVLLVMLFVEREFVLVAFPGALVVSFVFGAYLAARIAPLRRALSLPSRKRAHVEQAARAAFVKLGVSRTTGRTGILVFVALFERKVEVVADIGIDSIASTEPWTRAVAELEGSLRPGPAFDRFVERLRALGPPLAIALPRAENDVNELPDEVAE